MDYNFKAIPFGSSDARTEVHKNPKLLVEGYLDEMNIVDRALNSTDFLFLGYKGSGKSALGEHLKLSFADNPDVFITTELLNSFPYKLFGKVIKGDAEHEAKLPIAWQWILLLAAMNSFEKDQSKTAQNLNEWNLTVEVFRDLQLFPIKSITDIVNKASKRTFTTGIPKVFEFSTELNPINFTDPHAMIEYIKELLASLTVHNKHYLIIDGLDDFLSDREQQYTAVIALINQAKELNVWFSENDVPFKIIILCRTDLFERLSDPNKNKIKQDYTFNINWFDESETDDYSKSNLIKLANLRGRIAFPEISNIFKEFFPAKYNGNSIYQELLDCTRHTPRDFLQLLIMIQNSTIGNKVDVAAITSGIKKYSIEYFQSEIRDELAGYIPSTDITLTFEILAKMRKREFYLSDIQRYINKDPRYKSLNINDIFNVLFECSAIGHLIGPENKFYIKYRNRTMTFNSSERIILHKGLWKTFVS